MAHTFWLPTFTSSRANTHRLPGSAPGCSTLPVQPAGATGNSLCSSSSSVGARTRWGAGAAASGMTKLTGLDASPSTPPPEAERITPQSPLSVLPEGSVSVKPVVPFVTAGTWGPCGPPGPAGPVGPPDPAGPAGPALPEPAAPAGP